MVDEDLAVDPESLIKEFFVINASLGNVAHGEHAVFLQTVCLSRADLPEVRERSVLPEKVLVRIFIQLCDPYAVPVRRRFFCRDVHGYLGEIQVGPDSDRCGDPCCFQDIPEHGHCHDMGRMFMLLLRFLFIEVKIGRRVDEAFVNGIDVNVFGRSIAQQNGINQGRHPLIFRHARRGRVVEDPGMVRFFILSDRLLCFKKTRPGRNPDGFERRRNGKADRLVGT